MPRVVLFGASGQVGSALAKRLRLSDSLLVPARREADLTRPDSVASYVEHTRPQLVINAAAYTAVDAAESDVANAMLVNADSPGVMAAAAAAIGAVMVHFSTDYVYDGSKGAPYVEADATTPLNAYGRTKLAGDEAVVASGAAHLIFRTSWVYSATGKNFLLAIAKRAREAGVVRVVSDQVGAPTSADGIAEGCIAVIDSLASKSEDLAAALARNSGVYNMTASGSTTWFGFAEEIVRVLDIEASVEAITTEQFGAPAARPRYSLLDNSALRKAFGVALAPWQEQLATVVRQLPIAITGMSRRQ